MFDFCNIGYCTCFWDKIYKWVLTPCCKLHDFNYEKQHVSKWKADSKLFKCLRKHSHLLLASLMWLAIFLFGWFWWYKSKFKKWVQKKSKAILYYEEMLDWFSDENNHYLLKVEADLVHSTPFYCDFEVVNKEGKAVLTGVIGDGLGYDLITKKLKLIKRK